MGHHVAVAQSPYVRRSRRAVRVSCWRVSTRVAGMLVGSPFVCCNDTCRLRLTAASDRPGRSDSLASGVLPPRREGLPVAPDGRRQVHHDRTVGGLYDGAGAATTRRATAALSLTSGSRTASGVPSVTAGTASSRPITTSSHRPCSAMTAAHCWAPWAPGRPGATGRQPRIGVRRVLSSWLQSCSTCSRSSRSLRCSRACRASSRRRSALSMLVRSWLGHESLRTYP